ncbi:hypothetical protein PHYBLDRAFT_174492 [Phycomyces blakesleeanus NRRL 1555(-)]|uniref:No apical meristem-associated C-terminal domain-containing protein n=1 Tax=Phycomyces blakesleeanus (strain ATCC 8743b / DSM 1359 / FGSC 10004 / NBRC 33097 / NRRL 1555) TaxID=763407 RepID=A0A167K274_PHYB8|nr:hypothetical protein PHYBLDRAFT_174492 [Phycomyces blakesleeanus NRRL 1555(-)]OAD67106.1 hypothetical protein PHYBLDRAFT_174492 [Phycomyces blakesleeanus NRRL 1555(-)]|eukprot:XP_018285146.1 hypothetical protein PHYBLDRAFT_174492 [Phycomyces blakesleeanus NRRL 1555(-)]
MSNLPNTINLEADTSGKMCSNSSGTNNEWNETKADEVYFIETKTKFNLHHCFRILARHPKWKSSVPAKKKESNSKVAASAPNPIGEGIDEEKFSARSAGRKFTKEQEATKRKQEKNVERLIALHSESIAKGDERKKLLKKTMESNVLVVNAIRETNAVLQRTQDIKVLLINTSLIADPVSRQMMLDLKKEV